MFLLTASLSHAQIQSSSSVRGQVLVPSTRASERIEVILEQMDGAMAARTFSDTLGNYEFRSLQAGRYEIVVRLDGYEEVRQHVEVGSGIFGTAVVNILLDKKTVSVAGFSGEYPVVDVTELNRNYPKKVLQEYEKAQQDIRKGDTAKAVERLEAALKLAPDFYNGHNSLGTLYQKMGRYPDAETQYDLARQLNPRSAQPLVNLGSLYIQEADASRDEGRRVVGRILDQALDTLEEAIKLNSRSAIAHYLLGTAYYKSVFYEEAEDNLKRALDIDPRMGAPRLMLANLYIRQNRWEPALEHLDAYLKENPKAANRAQIQEVRSKVVEETRGQTPRFP